jgi:hypothetical protein
MQDYVQLYRKKRFISRKRQLETIRAFLVAGRPPVETLLAISLFLMSVRR